MSYKAGSEKKWIRLPYMYARNFVIFFSGNFFLKKILKASSYKLMANSY